jgi:hypothetical protein
MTTRTCLASAAACLAVAGIANAGVSIEGQGAPFAIDAAEMPGLFGGPADHDFSDAALAPIHAMLDADGVATDGKVTFMFLDTDDGLSFLALIDASTGDNEPGATELGMISSAPATASYWVNDLGDVDLTAEGGGLTSIVASFRWNDGKADAYAWSGLETGDTVTFEFNPMTGTALAGDDPFQFVTATEEGWQVSRSGDYVDDSFAFTFTVPTPGALALLGLAGLTGRTGRRRA